jgi:hypothetical protein
MTCRLEAQSESMALVKSAQPFDKSVTLFFGYNSVIAGAKNIDVRSECQAKQNS